MQPYFSPSGYLFRVLLASPRRVAVAAVTVEVTVAAAAIMAAVDFAVDMDMAWDSGLV